MSKAQLFVARQGEPNEKPPASIFDPIFRALEALKSNYGKLQPEPSSHHYLSETRESFGAVQASTSELHISSQVWWLTSVILTFGKLG